MNMRSGYSHVIGRFRLRERTHVHCGQYVSLVGQMRQSISFITLRRGQGDRKRKSEAQTDKEEESKRATKQQKTCPSGSKTNVIRANILSLLW